MSCTHSHKTKLQWEDTGPTWEDVAGVVRISPPDIGVSAVECTNLDSPDYAREYIAGLIEGGSCSFDLRFDGTQYDVLFSMLRSTEKWRVLFPDGTSPTNGSNIVFYGFFTALGTAVNLDDALQAMGVLKVTGKPDFNVGTFAMGNILPPSPPDPKNTKLIAPKTEVEAAKAA